MLGQECYGALPGSQDLSQNALCSVPSLINEKVEQFSLGSKLGLGLQPDLVPSVSVHFKGWYPKVTE